jgi:hypothetical protein
MSGSIIPIVGKRTIDFGGLGLGNTQAVILADRVELVHWQELTLLVKVHAHSLAASSAGTISIQALPCSWTDDDPGASFVCSAGSGPPVVIDANTLSPDFKSGFMRTTGPNSVGEMVRIVALGQRVQGGAFNATVSVELSAKDGSSFVPTRLSSCILWLHADDYNPSTGNWPDRSGLGNDGSQGNSSARPTVESKFNGFKDVLFDGSTQYISVNSVAASLAGTTPAPFSAIYLFELLTLPGSGAAVAPWTAGNSGLANPFIESQVFNAPPNVYRTWRRDNSGTFKFVGGTGVISTSTKYSVADVFSGTTMNVTLNGSLYLTGDLTEGQLDLNLMSIGAEVGASAVEFTNMRLREFAMFNHALSDPDVRNVTNGMRERAGLTGV